MVEISVGRSRRVPQQPTRWQLVVVKTIEKIEKRLAELGWKQNAFERSAQLAENRISKWKDGQGEPTLRQAFRMAKLLNVPLVYLADDEAVEAGDSHEITEDERLVLDLFHASGLSRREVIEVFLGWNRGLKIPARVAASAKGADVERSTGKPVEDTGPKRRRKGAV